MRLALVVAQGLLCSAPAVDMSTAAIDAGVPAGWAAPDEAYGNKAAFCAGLRDTGSATSPRCPAAT